MVEARLRLSIPALLFAALLEARAGIEPAYDGFADRCVTTSPPCRRRVQTTMFLLLWELRRGDGMVYVEDLKSSDRKVVWVRLPPPAQRR